MASASSPGPRPSDRSRAGLQRAQHPRDRLGLGPAPDPDRHAIDLNLDDLGEGPPVAAACASNGEVHVPATALPGPLARTAALPCRCSPLPAAALPAPTEQLLWRQPMATRNLRNHRPRGKRLLDDAGLVVLGEPAATRSRNHLKLANSRRLRLKLMVKRRHKPISVTEIATLADHQSQEKVGSGVALALSVSGANVASSPAFKAFMNRLGRGIATSAALTGRSLSRTQVQLQAKRRPHVPHPVANVGQNVGYNLLDPGNTN